MSAASQSMVLRPDDAVALDSGHGPLAGGVPEPRIRGEAPLDQNDRPDRFVTGATTSQWCVSRSSKAAVIFASPNARFVVTTTGAHSKNLPTKWNSSHPPLRGTDGLDENNQGPTGRRTGR